MNLFHIFHSQPKLYIMYNSSRFLVSPAFKTQNLVPTLSRHLILQFGFTILEFELCIHAYLQQK